MPTQARGMLTVDEAAAELGLSPITVRSAIRRGQLASQKLSSMHLVSPAALERYRREHAGKGPWLNRTPPRQRQPSE
jgi:excisionase family DNA binding protein